jgi:hypothetical protein
VNKAAALKQINEMTDTQAIDGYVLVMCITLKMDGTITDLDQIFGPLCRAALRLIVETAVEGEDPLRSVIH